MKLNLVGQDYTSRSLAVSAQACVNVFPALIDDPNEAAIAATVTQAKSGKNKGVLYGCPGKHLLGAVTDPRGVWSGGGRAFGVDGTNLVEYNAGGGVISTHALPGAVNDHLPAQIFSNGNQLLIVACGRAYCDNGAGPIACTTDNYAGVVNAFTNAVVWVSGDKFLTDGTWSGRAIVINGIGYTIDHVDRAEVLFLTASAGITPGVAYTALGIPLTAVTGGVMDGTFFVQRPRTPGVVPDLGRQVNFSAVLNGLSWSGLDFFQKEGSPDYIRGILVDNKQLYMFGDQTFEVRQADPNASLDGEPFIDVPGAMGHIGNRSAWAQASLLGRVYLLGGDDQGGPIAYVLNGFTPVRISNHAQESAWKAAGLGTNAVSYTYVEEGHAFLVINFGAQTWAYEPETGAWHTRYKWTGGAFAPYQTNLHTFIPEWGTAGVHLTACVGFPNLYRSDANFYDDAGTDIKWQRALPYVYNDGKWQYFGRLTLEMETGAVAAGPAPLVTMDYSDDRGNTFINPRTAAIGAHDETSTRVFWLRGGKSRGRVPRLSGIGQSKVALIDLEWEIELGVT